MNINEIIQQKVKVHTVWFKTIVSRGKMQKKEKEKKLTSVSFMYVCVAGNGEMLVFFLPFFPQQ